MIIQRGVDSLSLQDVVFVFTYSMIILSGANSFNLTDRNCFHRLLDDPSVCKESF